MNILFLDYDGVVNTPMWGYTSTGQLRCTYNFPSNNEVNNFQACQWVSEFCEKYNYQIVVTSTWRLHENYISCLYNGGLRRNVFVVGKTKSLSFVGKKREDEIQAYLDEHPDIENFIILDDEHIEGFDGHFVLCEQDCGFNYKEFIQAEELHKKMNDDSTLNKKGDM